MLRSASPLPRVITAGAVIALTGALGGAFPSAAHALMSGSAGYPDRQDGVRAFVDANGDGVYQPGERIVPGIDIAANVCHMVEGDEAASPFDCSFDDTLGEMSGQYPSPFPAVTSDEGRIHLNGNGADLSAEIPFRGGIDYPYLDHVVLRLPAGVSSPLAVDGVVDIQALRDASGALPAAPPTLQRGYFADGAFFADPEGLSPATRSWQLIDVPLSAAEPRGVLADAAPATADVATEVLARSRGFVQFGAVAFEDADGNGVMGEEERLIPDVGLDLEVCSQADAQDARRCQQTSESGAFATTTNGVLLDRTSRSSLWQVIELSTQGSASELSDWLAAARLVSLPAGWALAPRPAGWQDSILASQLDPSGAVGYSELGPADGGLGATGRLARAAGESAHPIDGSRTPLVIGYFNGGRFVADPTGADERSRLWNLVVAGLRHESATPDAPATVDALPPASAGPVTPAARIWVDANGDGAWDPASEPLVAGLPVDVEYCTPDEYEDTRWRCDHSAGNRTVSTAHAYLAAGTGDSPSDWWIEDLSHDGAGELDPTPAERIGDLRLLTIPAGFSVTTADANAAPYARASHADASGLVAALPAEERFRQYESGLFVDGAFVANPDRGAEGVRLYKFSNIGLRPNALEVSVAPCALDTSGACARPGHATITVRNATGAVHREVRPFLEVEVNGAMVDLAASCPEVAELADGATTTCEIDYDPGAQAGFATARARVESCVRLGVTLAASTAAAEMTGRFEAAPVDPTTTAAPTPPATGPTDPTTTPSPTAEPTATAPSTSEPTATATPSPSATALPTSTETATALPPVPTAAVPDASDGASTTGLPPASPGNPAGPAGDGLATSGTDAASWLALLPIAAIAIAAGSLLARRRPADDRA